jgi:hypothetical protein
LLSGGWIIRPLAQGRAEFFTSLPALSLSRKADAEIEVGFGIFRF